MRGTPAIPFSTVVQDTIAFHGWSWARRYYVGRGLTETEFEIFAGGY